jgi:hypothetical protein
LFLLVVVAAFVGPVGAVVFGAFVLAIGVMEYWLGWTAFPDLKFSVAKVVSDGDTIAIEGA